MPETCQNPMATQGAVIPDAPLEPTKAESDAALLDYIDNEYDLEGAVNELYVAFGMEAKRKRLAADPTANWRELERCLPRESVKRILAAFFQQNSEAPAWHFLDVLVAAEEAWRDNKEAEREE